MKMVLKLVGAVCAVLVASPLVQVAQARDQQKHSKSDTSSAAITGSEAVGPNQYKVLMFKKSESNLDDASKQQLKALIDSARAQGQIKTVHIAAWSDKQFPKGKTELKDADKQLAEDRISALKNYIEDTLQVSSVDTHSMAEHSGWLARAFNTTEAELKSLFAQRGAPGSEPEYRMVRKNGGASKAVIWVELDKSKSGTSSSGKAED